MSAFSYTLLSKLELWLSTWSVLFTLLFTPNKWLIYKPSLQREIFVSLYICYFLSIFQTLNLFKNSLSTSSCLLPDVLWAYQFVIFCKCSLHKWKKKLLLTIFYWLENWTVWNVRTTILHHHSWHICSISYCKLHNVGYLYHSCITCYKPHY